MGLTKDEAKAAMKAAIKEWMDERYATFGKWSAAGIAVAALGALAYFLVSVQQTVTIKPH